MDLSVYISELLNEHGTISIPQIGVFKQVRKRGYYNADEGKLYPPYFETGFEQQAVIDDTLLRYLIEKTKVSASSAKFFLDRYVQNIIQQAEIGEAMIGSLGWLSKEVDTITFRPAANVSAASAAFGFSPVSIGNEAAETQEKVAVAEAVAPTAAPETPVTVPQPETVHPVTAPATATTTPPQEPATPPQPEPVAPRTFSIEKELVEEPAPEVTEKPEVIEPVPVEEPAPAPIAEQEAPAEPLAEKTYSIEKELTDTPKASPKEEEPIAAKPKAPISPLVRQHKPADKPKPVAEVVEAPPAEPKPVILNAAEPAAVEDDVPTRPFYLRLPFYIGAVFFIAAAGIIMLLKNTANDKEGTPGSASKSGKSPSTDSVVVKSQTPADTVIIKVPAATDSTIRNTALPESTEFAPEVEVPASATTHPIINANNYKYVLIGGSYGTYEQALAASNRYKSVGISATPFENVRKLYKIALGYYKTYGEGQQAKQDFVKQGKVLSWKLYVETLRK